MRLLLLQGHSTQTPSFLGRTSNGWASSACSAFRGRKSLGGAGLDLLSYITIIYEMAKVDASHAITISAHTTLGTSPIVNFGNTEQKRRYVPLLASGKVLGGFGLTEPAAGSDAAGTQDDGGQEGRSVRVERLQDLLHHPCWRRGEIFVVTAVTQL